ncbi:type III-B CRISPR module RAMP protein Cmr1 [Iocasia frigidifontis]|uniref:Type III-B CRISPR module RAMP protein Cmr1 n=1 Tax=Iocasia fonsfrigidae TaxID=2682810 RepID=A0A8A7K6Z5_9FIRM|nr:type III-B CRISPR module RAMP protein Cmr1 [Iocasia fonsfrigidae]QTL97486.1 type III-B CRISPR module RAMP protein Cmr1 [Iocasia fonsfrigidae]
MEKVIVTCQLVTPLFMYGANNNLEIRASSIKGLLRYWWRTFNYADDHRELKKREDEIFGSTEKRSLINIRIRNKKIDPVSINEILSNEKKEDKNEDVSYLFYSLKLDKNNKEAFKAGGKFDIEFSYKGVYSDEIEEKNQTITTLNEYLKSLNVLQLLGGMGSRSRRGGGNFRITEVNVEGNDSLNERIEQNLVFKPTLNNYKNELKKSIELILIEKNINPKNTQLNSYPNIIGNEFTIYTVFDGNTNDKDKEKKIRTFDTWKKALARFNDNYCSFRKENYKDYNFGKKSTTKAIFGLPLTNDKSSKPFNFQIQKGENKKKFDINRLPSSLIFKIHKTSEDKYIPIMVRLSGNILNRDDYCRLYLKNKDEPEKLKDDANESLIDKFIEENNYIEIYNNRKKKGEV